MKLPVRKSSSHKGQNGRVYVIGGSEHFYGAPILTALGAEKSGVDLVFVAFPSEHRKAVEKAGLNFVLHEFQDSHFTQKDLPSILKTDSDVFVIGNGLGKHPETHSAIIQFLSQVSVPVVIDADALILEILQIPKTSQWILTPHAGEFERIFGGEAGEANIASMAQKYNCIILKKGPMDIIAHPSGKDVHNTTGVPQMSIGGTGDALAGIVAGFVAQGIPALDACVSGACLWGRCGEILAKKQSSFSAEEMLNIFPKVLFEEYKK